MMKRVIDGYHRFLCGLVALLVAGQLIPVVLQIASRYTTLVPTWMWTEELARFCLIWTILLGATVAVRERMHFDIDLLPAPKSAKGAAAARLTVEIVVAVFGLVFLWVATGYALGASNERSEITELPMVWMYAAFPVSALGWLLFLGEQIAEDAAILAGASR